MPPRRALSGALTAAVLCAGAAPTLAGSLAADGKAAPGRTVDLALALPAVTAGPGAAGALREGRAAGLGSVSARLRALGLRATAARGFQLRVSGSATAVDAVFGPADKLRVPAALRDLVSTVTDPAVVDAPLRHYGVSLPADLAPAGTTTPAELDQAYGLGAPGTAVPTAAQLAAAPIIATVQFSGWHSSDLTDYAQRESIYASAYDPVASQQYTEVDIARPAYDSSMDSEGSSGEVALDQEALLGTAPQLRQRAYIARNSTGGFLAAYDAVLNDVVLGHLPVSVLSTSWGACEFKGNSSATMAALQQRLHALTAVGVTIFAATGDSGRYDCSHNELDGVDNTDAVDFPASSPDVVAVGGTTHPNHANPPAPDTVYDEPGFFTDSTQYRGDGSGGGVSKVFSRPSWQATAGPQEDGRMLPDLSLDAAASTGIGIWHEGVKHYVGGTSLSSPLVAAQFATVLVRHSGTAAPPAGIGDVHAALYRSYPAGFTDVVASAATTGTVVRRVGPGFDMATGLGTPRWDVLAGTLFAPAPPPPAAPSLTTPATTVTDRARLHASAPAGVSAVRWYVSAGQDPACTGLGTQGPPADVTVREGQQQVWLRYVDQTLTCSTATTVPVTAPVDDLHVRLSAGWKRSGAQRAYHRTVAASARAGALASYTGRGSSFGAVLVTGHGGGIVQLVLDGRVARTFDTGVGPRRFGVLLSTRARHRGRHTVAVRVLGLAGRGGAATVTVDGFLVAP